MTKVLQHRTVGLISKELESIPEKYAKSNFASTHEAIAVIREEFMELEKEVFWGEKEAIKEIRDSKLIAAALLTPDETAQVRHKSRMKSEAIQLAAMCVRFIQELC
jgi:hypothetical protein